MPPSHASGGPNPPVEVKKDENEEVEEDQKWKQVLCLPYVKGLLDRIAKRVQSHKDREAEIGLQHNNQTLTGPGQEQDPP